MPDDVRIATTFPTHRKTKRLHRRLGADGVLSLIYLWAWAGGERWTGDLSGLTDEDIEDEAHWSGAPGTLVAVLVELRFLTGPAGARRIHDWAKWNPYAANKGARIIRGKKAASARWASQQNELPLSDPAPRAPDPGKTPSIACSKGSGMKSDAPSTQSDASCIYPQNGEKAENATSMRSGATSTENDALEQCPPAPTKIKSESRARAHEVARAVEQTARTLFDMGCRDVSPSDARLVKVLADGMTPAELIDVMAQKGKGKGLAYLIATAVGRRRDAEKATPPTPEAAPQDPERVALAAKLREQEDIIIEARHLAENGHITPEKRDRLIADAKRAYAQLQHLQEERTVKESA